MKKHKIAGLAAGVLLVVCLVAVSSAFFQGSGSFTNLFGSPNTNVKFSEEFTPPENWLPGDSTKKTVTGTNEGSNPVVFRLSYKDVWTDSEGAEQSNLVTDGDKTYEAAVKMFGTTVDNSADPAITGQSDSSRIVKGTGGWTYYDGYYYYLTVLNRNQSTSPWITSVQFNSRYEDQGEQTITYRKKSDGSYEQVVTGGSTAINALMDAEYHLTVDMEAVQATQAAVKEAWGLDAATMTAGNVKNFISSLEQ